MPHLIHFRFNKILAPPPHINAAIRPIRRQVPVPHSAYNPVALGVRLHSYLITVPLSQTLSTLIHPLTLKIHVGPCIPEQADPGGQMLHQPRLWTYHIQQDEPQLASERQQVHHPLCVYRQQHHKSHRKLHSTQHEQVHNETDQNIEEPFKVYLKQAGPVDGS